MSERITGSVKWFSNSRGYGFIERDDSERDVFVHHQNVVMEGYRTLKPGQRVEFSVDMIDKGPNAVEVQVVD